ncbi:YcbK family protein [Pararhizobium haloflavum]|uniref:YcbK family protein n=1 Tax=Pararhizobium haloflavum TaxID=2037914 RepID=UPI001FDF2987|nr:D-Ala-D-Ala carboxypeptidase family metallohydrolase [Pararhizobium haloflavum]
MQRRANRSTNHLAHFKLLAMAGCLGIVAGCAVSDDGALSIAPGAAVETAGSSSTEDIQTADAQAVADDGESATASEGSAAQATAAAVDDESADASVAATDQAAPTDTAAEAASTETAAQPVEVAAADPAQRDTPVEAAEAEPAAAEDRAPAALAVVAEPEKAPSPFARLFSRSGKSAEKPVTEPASPRSATAGSLFESDRGETEQPAGAAEAEEPAEPETSPVTTASIATSKPQARLSVAGGEAPLPGVREVSSLYQLSRREGFDYNSYDEENGTVQVASAVGLAALAGSRLAVQHKNVDVSCLKPGLVQTIRRIEAHFGRQVVVTSGYRNKSHNRRVGGARESKHMSCEAADIQVAGVSKWQIAEFARSLPGRGGVGTYCHTESVHVDVGSKRDWNWRCRRRN